MKSTSWVLSGIVLFLPPSLLAQSWDLGGRVADSVQSQTESRLKLSFEQRGRYESRTGQGFGRDADLETGLYRTRIGLSWKAASWLKASGMMQDSRAPWFGLNAPSSMRDSTDLQEGYVELFPDQKSGFGMTAGRMMLNYGESRLIGAPQWGNLARTFDHARAYWRTPQGQFEVLLLSPAKVRLDEFNTPVLGERIWGMYHSLPKLTGRFGIDAYILRHDQNRPGGFSGGRQAAHTDRLRVNTFGGRFILSTKSKAKLTLEGALQNGKAGAAAHHGGAWFSSLTRRWQVSGKPLDVTGEYKFASGTKNPQDTSRVSTFDQMSPANHDKFGHEDLFGWRNIHNVRPQVTLGLTKSVAANAMYNNYWLASPRDALYNGAGRAIVRSATGTDGRHIGQEADLFATCKYRRFLFGAGLGYFFEGRFIRATTPGAHSTYAYLFHSYSF